MISVRGMVECATLKRQIAHNLGEQHSLTRVCMMLLPASQKVMDGDRTRGLGSGRRRRRGPSEGGGVLRRTQASEAPLSSWQRRAIEK